MLIHVLIVNLIACTFKYKCLLENIDASVFDKKGYISVSNIKLVDD